MSFENERAQGTGEFAIRVTNVSKCYHIYDKPQDRLKQSLWRGWKQYYREFWALKDVSFEIAKGETVGIIGRNGSGKSTLLQIIAGTLTPSSGEIEIKGRVAALLELGSGFNPDFTGRENIYLSASILGLKRNEIDARFDDIVAFADIGDFIEQPVKTYSSGMFVRLAFSIQANVEPEILIVDEALAVGDAYFVHRCMLRFHELQKRGTTILFVSHDATAVRQLCSRAIWLREGGIVMMANSVYVTDHYLADLFDHAIVENSTSSETTNQSANGNEYSIASHAAHETAITNIDRRSGNQACSIVGASLYDLSRRPISATPNDSEVVFRITIRNNFPDRGVKPIVGYTFRDFHGLDISSSDTAATNTDLGYCPPGALVTIAMKIQIPLLHPGTYSLSPAIGYIDISGIAVETDRIQNAVVLEITSASLIRIGMRFKTEFSVELIS